MPAANPITFDVYQCRAVAYDADGFLVIQPATPGGHGSAFHEYAGPLGLQSRPLETEVDAGGKIVNAAPLLVAWEGGQALVIPLADRRTVAGLAALQPGETMLHGAFANFFRCHDDGALSATCTADGTLTGETVQTKQGPAGFLRAGPWGRETLDETGWHLSTTSGACAIDVGGIGGLPAPLDTLGSYVKIQAACIRLNATVVAAGPPGTPQDAVAKSTPTLLALGVLNAVLAVLETPGAFVSPAGPCEAGPGLLAALATAIATLAGAPAALPSNSLTST